MLKILLCSLVVTLATLNTAKAAMGTEELDAVSAHADDAQDDLARAEQGDFSDLDRSRSKAVINNDDDSAASQVAEDNGGETFEPASEEANEQEEVAPTTRRRRARTGASSARQDDYMAAPAPATYSTNGLGRLARRPNAATGISFGATLLGLVGPTAMLVAAQNIILSEVGFELITHGLFGSASSRVQVSETFLKKEGTAHALYHVGLVLMGATLGFGPLIGYFCALGKQTFKYAKTPFILAIARTAISILVPIAFGALLTLNEHSVGNKSATYLAGLYLGALGWLPVMGIWALVDLCIIPKYLRRAVRIHDGRVQMNVAPYFNGESGGVVLGMRF